MQDEFDTLTATKTPTLSFGAAPEPELPAEKEPEQPVQAEPMDDSILSDEEKKQVEEFASKIDLGNSAGILQYGAGTQQKMADFSEKALERVKTKDLGEVGGLISGLVGELKSFDAEEEDKGLFGFFKKQGNKLSNLKNRYDKAEANVDKIVDMLETHQVTLMKDIDMLDKMCELAELIEKAQKSQLPEDAQAAKDLESQCDRFEKKLHDLELTRMISIQTAPQIRMVQSSDTMMAEKIQSTIVNTIPLWKSQMVIALGVEHSTEAAKAQRAVSDMTNELLKKNAEKLKTATIETAKESERGIVDMETLKATNESLISTLDEVMKIQTEGRAKRAAAENELRSMENQLKDKLLEIRR